MFTIEPLRAPMPAATASRVQSRAAITLISSIFAMAECSVASVGPKLGFTPALLTKWSRMPNSRPTRSKTSARWSESSALPATQRADAPSSTAAARRASSRRAVMSTRAPSSTSRLAVANPMPRLAPVMRAARPSKRFMRGPYGGSSANRLFGMLTLALMGTLEEPTTIVGSRRRRS